MQPSQTAPLSKVILISSSSRVQRVTFDVSPVLAESRSVEYTSVVPIHLPGGIQVYKNTNSRTFSLTAPLISRTVGEATTNSRRLQQLRSWTLPYFGIGSSSSETAFEGSNDQSAQSYATATSSTRLSPPTAGTYDPDEKDAPFQPTLDGTSIDSDPSSIDTTNALTVTMDEIQRASYDLLGAPPDVLLLSAYAPATNTTRTGAQRVFNLSSIPVVVTSLNITYPNDVDYIPTLNNEPFPTKMDISIELLETHAPVEYERFSLQQYRAGKLTNF